MNPTLSRRRMPCAWPSLLCSVFLSVQALAQPAASPRRPDPLDPKAAVPALRYESATAQNRPIPNEKAVTWREANDAVARIGGWRVYARESQSADATMPAPPVTAPPEARPPAGMPAAMAHPPMPAGHGDSNKP